MNEVKIQWLGHSCFCMEYREYSIVTDPYEDGYVRAPAPYTARTATATTAPRRA